MKKEDLVSIVILGIILLFLFIFYFSEPSITGMLAQTSLITKSYDFPFPETRTEGIYDLVTMSDLEHYGEPGEPILPFKTIKILLQYGQPMESIKVTPKDKTFLDGSYYIKPGQKPYPLSYNGTIEFTQPNETIYSSTEPFPGKLYSKLFIQRLAGYDVLVINLYPVQYIPKDRKVYYYKSMDIEISTPMTTITITAETAKENNFRGLARDKERVANIVDNPETLQSYAILKTTSDLSVSGVDSTKTYQYVIITNSELNASFQPLIDWKRSKGLNATTVLVEDIVADPDYWCDGSWGDGCGSGSLFNDTQAMIRNFIKDAYNNWGTEYVLLGGDDEIIPVRGMYVYSGSYTDYNIPTDMYYGALDGSWDADNDSIWGEAVQTWGGPENGTAGEEADFFVEVFIGRATVDNATEAANFVNKTIEYEKNKTADYLKKALMIGERLDARTEGGNDKDRVSEFIPQYTTTRLYDRDGTFSSSAVINAMNNGTHIVNHNGHAWWTGVMGLSAGNVASLTNTDYFLAYSIGCYSNAFDNVTSGSSEAISEHFIKNPVGAFAYIGNTRYGWYCPGGSCCSAYFDNEFFDALSNKNITNIGKTLEDSKQDLISYMGPGYCYRWIYYDLALLGDPETGIVVNITAPTAHFRTRTDLLTPPSYKGIINLTGTAKRGNTAGSIFSNYTIEYGLGISPSSWSSAGIDLINDGLAEVDNGTLAIWDTSLTSDGTYTIKLTVYDNNGITGEDRHVVIVDNVYLTYPQDGAFIRAGENITITGTADGTNFLNYTLEYGKGKSPVTWTLINSSSTPVTNGTLGIWNTSSITKADYYMLKLTVYNFGDYNSTDEITVVLDPDYQIGWPQKVRFRLVAPSPGVVDIDGDGKSEIIEGEERYKNYESKYIYAWYFNGTNVTGWPKYCSRSRSSPAIADVDDDGDKEIFIGCGYSLYAYSYDGNLLWSNYLGDEVYSSPAIGDIDNDGDLEIVIGSMDNKIYAFHANGNTVSGWPITTGGHILSSPALADLDNDGDLEIIIGSWDKKVYALHHDGTNVSGWPIILGNWVTSSPALGDIDNDGDLEIVVGSDKLYALHHDGTNVTGWPIDLGWWVTSSPALGDIDNDGDLEIAVSSSNKLYALHHDGTDVSGWPKTVTYSIRENSPIIGDIDGDGNMEILISTDHLDDGFYAWHHDGTDVAGWPKLIPSPELWSYAIKKSSAVIEDIDKDGDVEVILGDENYMLVWDLDGAYNPRYIEWGQFHHDAQRTGLYISPVVRPVISQIHCQENNTVWRDCSHITYGVNLTQVRVNCTDPDGFIVNATFKLENLLTKHIFFDANASFNISDWWGYDNDDISIKDFGEWRLVVICYDNSSAKNSGYVSWVITYSDIGVGLGVDYYLPIDQTATANIYLYNIGTKDAKNLTANFYDVYEYQYVYAPYNETQIAYFNNTYYNITAYRIDDTYIRVNVSYNDIYEEFVLFRNKIVGLKDGIFLDVDWVGSSDCSLYLNKADIILKDLLDLAVNEKREDYVNWTPIKLGYHRLKVFVNVSDDYDWTNNYAYDYAWVKIDAPDVDVDLDVDYYLPVNQTTTARLYLDNDGLQDATNLTANFYDIHEYYTIYLYYNETQQAYFNNTYYNLTSYYIDRDYVRINITYDSVSEEFVLFDEQIVKLKDGTFLDISYIGSSYTRVYLAKADIISKDLEDLATGQSRTDYLNWTPTKLGEHRLKVFVNVSNDGDWTNNYAYDFAYVHIPMPTINQIQCYKNNVLWTSCSNITYQSNLTKVRVNCTDPDYTVVSALYRLTNVPDDKLFFDASNATSVEGDWWEYDNPDVYINDSGDWKLEVSCTNNMGGKAEASVRWLVEWGSLEPYLIFPISATNVSQYGFFNFSSGARCVGGECGDISAKLDPEQSYEVEYLPNEFNGSCNTLIQDSCDDCYVKYDLPWTFNFYGDDYNWVYVSTNGLIDFDTAGSQCCCKPSDYHHGKNAIAALWGDLYANNIFACTYDDRVVIRFDGETLSDDYDVNYEIVLYQSGEIKINYGNIGAVNNACSGVYAVGISGTDYENYIDSSYPISTDNGDTAHFFLPVKGVIPMNNGTPFYTIDQNPVYPANLSCLRNMQAEDSCNQTWRVNATGNHSSSWDFFTVYSATYSGVRSALTNKINITILNIIPPIIFDVLITPTIADVGELINISADIYDINGIFSAFAIIHNNLSHTIKLIAKNISWGSIKDILEQGQIKTYTLEGKDYEVEVVYIGGTPLGVKFKVDGENTITLYVNDSYILADGTPIKVIGIWEEEAGEITTDFVEFELGESRIYVRYFGTWNTSNATEGTYLVDINATDNVGNTRIVKNVAIIGLSSAAEDTYTNNTVTIPANETTIVSSNETGVELEISTITNVTDASVNIVKYSENIETTNYGVLELDVYVDIVVVDEIENNLDWAIIKVYYTYAEVAAAGIDEVTLKIYYYNESSGSWQLEPTQGVNIVANYVWANVTHFSMYGLFGSAPPAPAPAPAPSRARPGCPPIWNCTEWSVCYPNGTQTRFCVDTGPCKFGNRTQTRSCEYVPPEYVPTCDDGMQNQDETDIDCGGTICPPCPDGKRCRTDADCVNKCNVTIGVCYTPKPVVEIPIVVKPQLFQRIIAILPVFLYAVLAAIVLLGTIYTYRSYQRRAFYKILAEVYTLIKAKNIDVLKSKYDTLKAAYGKLSVEDRQKAYKEIMKCHGEIKRIVKQLSRIK